MTIKDRVKEILKKSYIQNIVCYIMSFYMRFVYFTSKVKICGCTEEYVNLVLNKKATFVITWHGRIFVAPIIVKNVLKKINYRGQPCVLSSKHRDGQLASKTMKIFNFQEIFGSTINKKKLYQAESSGAVKSIRIIMKKIKSGATIHLAPDGPRGPLRKINSEITAIASKNSTPIFPVAISYSFKKQLKSWDEFQIPLPFGKILVEYFEPVCPDSDFEKYNSVLEGKLNIVLENDKKIKNMRYFDKN